MGVECYRSTGSLEIKIKVYVLTVIATRGRLPTFLQRLIETLADPARLTPLTPLTPRVAPLILLLMPLARQREQLSPNLVVIPLQPSLKSAEAGLLTIRYVLFGMP